MAFLLAGIPWRAAAQTKELTPTITEVAPGVFRLRAGEREKIVPSLVREPARTDALAKMPKVSAPPLTGIKVWRLARGIRIELPLRNDEVIYGLGLQCKHLEQNGWRRTLYTAPGDDNGTGMSHAPVPFYVSTAGYGVLVDSARCVTFSVGEEQRLADLSSLAPAGGKRKIITDVAALYGPEKRDRTSVYVDVPAARGVDVYLFAGPQMGDAIARYNLYSGGGCLPSLAGLGPHYIFGTMLNASSVLAMSDEIKQERIPVTTVGLEPGWETHVYSSSYLWNTDKFPRNFGETMRERGYDLYLWCQMYLDPSSPLVPLLGGRFGDFDVWHGLVPDVADPTARKIYGNFLATNFISRGIAGFKLDEVDGAPKTSGAYQNWMFPDFTAFPSGADGDQLRNLLGRLGAQAMTDAFRRENRRTFSLVRANQAWAAPLPFTLYSDEYNFGDYVRYDLSAGVQGLIWAPEVRNADNERDWALRVGAAALSAKMVYNGWQFPHLIWQQPNLDAAGANDLLPDNNPYERLARYFNNLRMALLPYLYQAYSDYQEKGIAPVRPLVADWPEDPGTWHLDDEWMLGADLLVAPVTDGNAFAELYRVVPSREDQFKSDPGVRIKFQEGVLSLDIAGTNDGLPGASMEFDLKAGPCAARLLARGDIGRMAMRLRRVENGHESDVGELYKDDIQLDSRNWKELRYQFNVPSAGHYRLSVGKGYFQRLPEPRNLEIKNISFEQRTGNPQQSWQRMVYLPAGGWRDFWTGAAVAGGQSLAVTATAEHPPVFVRDNTLLPLAEPVVTLDSNTVFNVHLAAYGGHPRPCQLREDDGTTFDYEQGKWATITAHPDGTVDRPEHGQPKRYQIIGKAQPPENLLRKLLGADQTRQQFINDRPWPDNNGVPINAHGGGILYHNGVYYWFGEHKVAGTLGNSAQVGVHCYRSTDLYNWTDAGIALAVSDDPKSEITKGCIIERPKVIYNAATKTFVMWFHLELKGQGYSAARAGIAVSQTPEGPYRYLRSIRPHAGVWPVNANAGTDAPGLKNDFNTGQMVRDMTLFVDDDGAAYLIAASEDNATIHISRLTDDYRDVSKTYARALPGDFREAPAICKCQGRYWLITSACSSWAPNAAGVAVADSILGPWKMLGNPCEGVNPHNGLGPEKTFGGQSTFILPVHGKTNAFIAMFDVWEPGDAIKGRYIWLPITFDHDRLRVKWREKWDLSFFDGHDQPAPEEQRAWHDVPETELKKLPGVSLISADASCQISSHYGPEQGSGKLLDAQDGEDAFAFHTENEPDANVVIDLKREKEIVGATILNRADDRPDIENRAASLAMWLSDDNRDWRCVWKADSAQPVWSFELNQPQRARYVKIGLRDANFLHLKRVRIYGR